MNPYADFTYFAVLLYVVVPTLALGLFGRAGWRWALLVTAAMLFLQYHQLIAIHANFAVRGICILLGFALWQWGTVRAFAQTGARGGWPFRCAIGASLLPLVAVKVLPLFARGQQFGFLGISYVTFRALDVVFCLRDEVIAAPGTLDFLAFLFFFPTISSGPIDRYRRFFTDWKKRRTPDEFLVDLDGAVHRVFRGFFYKFIIAALIKEYWLTPAASGHSIGAITSYMYAYSLYLFFDFAGYSAFAIGLSYLFGVHTPENFDRPFLARNIRDFWNRWHITLSFWFRDHVYMRFLLAAARGKWFASKETAPILGYFLAFGLMGLWHGIEPHYLLYGLYQAVLLSAYHLFSRWSKTRRARPDGPVWRTASVVVTFQFVCFGFLIFSGHIDPASFAQHPAQAARTSGDSICRSGWNKPPPHLQPIDRPTQRMKHHASERFFFGRTFASAQNGSLSIAAGSKCAGRRERLPYKSGATTGACAEPVERVSSPIFWVGDGRARPSKDYDLICGSIETHIPLTIIPSRSDALCFVPQARPATA